MTNAGERQPARAHPAVLAVAAMTAGWLYPASAAAQTIPPGLGVADRPRPGFDPLGIDVGGSFTLSPNLAADLNATDNFRASNTDRQGDVYLVVVPEARLASEWSRHAVSARTYFSRSIHARLTSEDVSNYGASANGKLDLSRNGQVSLDVAADHRTEGRASLSSFQGTPSPVSYDVYRVGVSGGQVFNRLVLNAAANVEERDFADVAAADGTIIDQDFRDVRTVSASASARLEVRSGVSALVSGQLDDSSYSATPDANQLRRDATGFNVLAGVSLELSSLIFGQIQVGFINRAYADPQLKDISGPSYRADLLWNVTPLTSLRLTGSRTVEDAASTAFAGNTRSEIRLAVDHELYRYIILSADTVYSSFSANGPGAKGDEFSIGGGARYLLGRRWSINGRLRYAQRSSNSPGLRYHAATATIAARLAF